MIQDHTPIPIDKFLGLYGIDDFEDSVPRNFFIDELNTITYGDELHTRDGVDISIETGPIRKFVTYRRQGEAARILALIYYPPPADMGEIWDLTTSIKIYSVAGMTDFAIGYYNNRAFISPHNGVTGLPGQFIQVYSGSGSTRPAGGKAPTAGFTVVVGATGGHIEKGKHLFAWAFETDSGFVTGPNAEVVIDMDGTHKVNFSSIPVGPTGTVARRLLASRAIQEYNGNPLSYEMFFVSGGRIPNNTVTILNDVDFYDVDLQFSADYTYDQLEELPAVLFIAPYGKRQCYGSPNFDRNSVWISKPLEPESVHSTAGFITCDPFETEGVKDGTEFRDNFYICKRTKTYTVRDNGFEPSTWRVVTLDSAIGCDVNGIAKYYDSSGSRVEFFTVSSPSGIFKFAGLYDEIPLSRHIKHRIWAKIDQSLLNRCVTLIDQETMRLYMTIPIDGEGRISHILVGNFENGFTLQGIKWHVWNFQNFLPSYIGLDRDADKKPQLKISSLDGNLYKMVRGRRDDVTWRIINYVKFALVAMQPNSITHVGAIGFRLKGAGLLQIELYGEDEVDYKLLPSLNMTCMPGKEFIILTHFQSEKASLRIETEDMSGYFYMRRIDLYANVIFNSRPLL